MEGLASMTYNESQNTIKHAYGGAESTPKKNTKGTKMNCKKKKKPGKK